MSIMTSAFRGGETRIVFEIIAIENKRKIVSLTVISAGSTALLKCETIIFDARYLRAQKSRSLVVAEDNIISMQKNQSPCTFPLASVLQARHLELFPTVGKNL